MAEAENEPKKLSQKELEYLKDQAVDKGAIDAILHFDAHGTQQDAVENAMIDMISRAAKVHGILYCTGEIEKAIQAEDGLYSVAAEVKVIAADFDALLVLTMKFGPIAVEIMRPSRIVMNIETAQACLLDASLSSQDFAKFVIENVLDEQGKARYNEQMLARAKLGEEIRKKGEIKKEG